MSLEIVVDGISWETSSLYKVKAILAHWPSAKVLLLAPVGEPKFVNVSLLKKNIVTFVMTMSSSFFTLCTDESMCAMKSALLVPIQMWKSTFMSWSFMSVLTSGREDLGKHNVHTHFPKDRNCEICKRTKITRAPCRRRNGETVPRAVIFGDLIKADHKVLSDNCESRNNHRYAVVVQDLATQWIQAYPCKNKTSQETQSSLQKFLEPERKPKVIYTDNSLEFGKACEDLSWNHCTSTPLRSETNGIAERAVRRLKEGTSAVLLQSGLNESWWADSMECYTYLRNVTDLLSDGKDAL